MADLLGRSPEALAGIAVAEHIKNVIYTDLRLLGCYDPPSVADLIRDVLALMPTAESMASRNRPPIVRGNVGAANLILTDLLEADLIWCAGILDGAWCTDKGEWLLAAPKNYPIASWDLTEAGCPHPDCVPRADECWIIPTECPPFPADATRAGFW